MTKSSVCLVALANFALCGPAAADATLSYATEGVCPAIVERIDIAGSRLRLDSRTQGQSYSSLFDGSEDLLIALMHDGRQYHQIEVDEDAADYAGDVSSSSMKYMDRQLAQGMAQMQEQCKKLEASRADACAGVPDIQAMMQAMMPKQPQVDRRDGGRDETLAGLHCHWTEWWVDGRKQREDCYGDDAGLPISDRDKAGFLRGMRVITRYGDSFASMKRRFGNPLDQAPPKDQVLVAQVCYGPTGEVSGRVAVSVGSAPVDPSRFEVPPGYKPLLMQEGSNPP